MIKIALAQLNSTLGDLQGNSEKFLRGVRLAKAKKADVVVFPELFLSGYPTEDLIYYDDFLKDVALELGRVVPKVKGITAIVGFPSTADIPSAGGATDSVKIYNSAAVISDGKIVAIQNKSMLPNYGVFDEKRYFEPAKEHYLFEAFRGRSIKARFGITICEDIWVDNGPHKTYARAGADLIINLSSSPYHTGKWDIRRDLLERRTKKDGVFVTYTNLVGGQDELVFDGRSMAVDPRGELMALGKAFEEDVFVVELPIKPARATSTSDVSTSKLINVKLSLASNDPAKTPIRSNRSSISKIVSERSDTDRDDLDALVLGLRDYFLKNGFKKAIIGLSGGIDSALTTAIAVKALGVDNVNCLMMPSEFSSKGSISDSKRLAKNLGIKCKSLPIKKLYNSYLAELKKDFKGLLPDVTEQNLQARIRGNLLMAYANKFGYLVLATGNKSELAVGYSTLYGDMVGGFAVIKDLFKGRVYALSELINSDAGYDLIPSAIIKKAPSAELKPDQKDEDDLPPYPILDEVLRLHIEENKNFKEIEAAGFDHTTVHRVISLVNNAEYKRRQGPIGVKISPRAFGRDRRMPITNRYHFK